MSDTNISAGLIQADDLAESAKPPDITEKVHKTKTVRHVLESEAITVLCRQVDISVVISFVISEDISIVISVDISVISQLISQLSFLLCV
ncbi:hypothetical protein Bpfe_008368 [Biomphalaria pfeifferi]|uniref:Uncharacterized protein n=1 Tax=Biomphalaria pfeifferi TaxID=112525 RepID=A0AAD8FER9_BIOPF|nr:hypothetical protein Bpfe_008368 [Biomphalaria pfeifferi]